jgi:hypothetical protein
MANIDYKAAPYTIAANNSQTFTFWWGRDSKAPKEYFDVSISPEDANLLLVEEKREIIYDITEGAGRVILNLTLRNNNNAKVTFMANHVRIY